MAEIICVQMSIDEFILRCPTIARSLDPGLLEKFRKQNAVVRLTPGSVSFADCVESFDKKPSFDGVLRCSVSGKIKN